MSTASLTRMSVPLEGDSPSQGLLMPILKHRFRVTFQGFGVSATSTELTKQVIDFTRPSVNWDNIDIPVYNSTVKLLGRHNWDDVSITLRDDATGAVNKLVAEQLQKQLDFAEQSSAASGIDYKFQTTCEILDGGNGAHAPTVLTAWELYGCYVQSANYGDLNYGTSDAATIALTIRFDNAVQTPDGTGIGTDIGRTLGNVVTG